LSILIGGILDKKYQLQVAGSGGFTEAGKISNIYGWL